MHMRLFFYYALHGEVIRISMSGMCNVIGFSWESSPACTELETLVLNWLAVMLGLPPVFLNQGILQGSASEGILVAVIAARERAINQMRLEDKSTHRCLLMSKFTLYASDQAHTSMQKAARIAGLEDSLRIIPTSGPDYFLTGQQLRVAMEADIARGLVPIFACATVGTTSSCVIEDVEGMGLVCRDYGAWLHVDAAYAGSASICPEYREILLRGVELADSYVVNLHKWCVTVRLPST